LAVAAAVVAAHGLLLNRLPRSPGPGWQAGAARPLQVRRIAPPAMAPAPAARAPAVAAPGREPAVPSPAAVATGPLPAAAAPAATSAPATISATAAAPTHSTTAAAAAPATTATAAEPAPEPGGPQVPVYATRLPPPATLRYRLHRGAAGGWAELQWRPAGAGYEMALHSQAAGAAAAGWTSSGGFDAAGLAPERHVESRRGRDLRAANFQRAAGRITFSGPALEYPLLPGAQDRLSWMVQLGAVLAADPAPALPGAQVSMFVVGTRGDGEVWTFKVDGRAAVELPAGEVVDAVHLVREPSRPYDTRVDVWLDPARHHLPVRTRLVVRATGEGSEFLLEQFGMP
jgi:hypothetical protein